MDRTPLCLGKLLAQLPQGFPWGNFLQVLTETDSTNTQAKRLAASGAPHGTVVLADRQTGGRGRLGRSFHSPGGMGIYLSVILRPHCPPQSLMHLTCAVAVAMCRAVAAVTGVEPGVKWINDLVVGKKKLAGILTELSLDSAAGEVAYAVVGVGINCCQTEADFPPELQGTATSLALASGQDVDRNALAAAMIAELYAMSEALLTRQTETMAAYRQLCVTLGNQVSLHRFEEVRHGYALDVDEEGALVVEFPDGHRESVSAGEVSVRGMYGYI